MRIDQLFDQIYVIHVPRMVERRPGLERTLAEAGCRQYCLIDAVDGDELDLESMIDDGRLMYCEDQNRELMPGEVGCYLSHLEVYTRMIDTGLDTALICEDDILFAPMAERLFTHVMAEVPQDWDIIHFHSHQALDNKNKQRKPVSTHIQEGDNESDGTLCYAITRRCARFFLDHALPIRNPIDGVTNWPTSEWCKDYHGYIANPFPCQSRAVPSSIGDKSLRQ